MATRLQHAVPKELLVYIGDMTVSFALLESGLKTLAESLLGAGQRLGQIVTAELFFKALRALAESLYLHRNGEDQHYPVVRDLLRRANELEQRRNVFTHSVWGAGEGTVSVQRFKTTARERHGVKHQSEEVTVDDFASLVLSIQELAYDIQRFHFELIGHGKATNG